MDYLLVVPYTPFYHWQTALLAQSFKILGLEENLTVLFCLKPDQYVTTKICNVFSSLPRVHKLQFQSDQDPDILRLRGIAHAIDHKLVSQPFVTLPPYSVLRLPITEYSGNLSFTLQQQATPRDLELMGIDTEMLSKRMSGRHTLLPIGDVICCDRVSSNLFNLAAIRAELICFDGCRKQLREKKDPMVRGLFKAGLSLATMEFFSSLTINTSMRYECWMRDHDNKANVINYCHGMPPHFSRYNYTSLDKKGVVFSDDPFRGIYQTPDTHASIYMKAVAQSINLPQPSADSFSR